MVVFLYLIAEENDLASGTGCHESTGQQEELGAAM